VTEDNQLRAGDLLDGKYRIEARVGQGGMGSVYRGTHLHTTRTVAIKVIRPHLTSRDEFVERFRREAEAAGRLRHPNVVDVTDFGFAATARGRVAYLVMEFLDGCTLSDILAEEKRLPVSWAVDIVEQVSSALDEAHAQGIVHRDLKPENIWLEPNRRGGYTVKVLDFGLVKLGDIAAPAGGGPPKPTADFDPVADAASGGKAAATEATEAETIAAETIADTPTIATDALTRLGSITGTPMYMSPEQCRGDQVDGRSDIYSLGVIAYRMLSGHAPFVGDARALMRAHLTDPPPPLHQRVRRVPRAVADLVMSALAKEPAARPSRAGGFASAMRAAAEGSGTLLRQAIAVYGERFPVLLRLSAVAYVPLFLFLIGIAVLDARGVGSSPGISLAIILGMIAMNVGSYLAIPALVTPIVFQSFVAPLRRASLTDAWTAVRRRWKTLVAATALVIAVTAAWSLLLIVPGVVAAIAYVLYAPVVIMEDISARDALRRARHLARRAWSTVLIITVLQFALPVLVWFAAVDSHFVFRLDENWQPKELSFSIGASWSSAMYQLLDIFVAPLTGTMTALLYLKSRQAGGERLRDADDAAAASGTASRWQRRMRSRSRMSPVPIGKPSAPSPAGN
jgi:serine/threonine protein kinase